MLLTRKISTIALSMLFCATFTKSISADTSTNHPLENEYQNRQVIERYAIENNEDTLFNQARENTEGITIDENGNYIKLNSCSGSASKLNSGVKVQNLTIKIGCVAPVAPNQRVTKDYGTATSFSYTPPTSWKQVPNIIGGSTGSLVGSTMNVKLGRSTGSTWTQAFTNNIGFNSNVPIS